MVGLNPTEALINVLLFWRKKKRRLAEEVEDYDGSNFSRHARPMGRGLSRTI